MITGLFRYPVKGLSGEAVNPLQLIAGEGIEGDRALAIARNPNVFDPASPKAAPKTKFLMLALDEALAKLQTRYDTTAQQLTIDQGDRNLLTASVVSQNGQGEIANFFADFIAKVDLDPTLVAAPGHKFTDISVVSAEKMRAISLINLASVRALSAAIGQSIDIRRFRANIYFDTGTAWEELEWIDKEIEIGAATAKCVMLTKRCPATEVNPDTAERDIRLPKELLKHFGHVNMGIYAEVQTSGEVLIGDPLVLQKSSDSG